MDERYNPDPQGKAEELDFDAMKRKDELPKTFYIKAPLDSGGIVAPRGKMEIVESRASATEVVFGDADFLEGLAFTKRPDLHWQKEEVNDGKYIVKGDPIKG